MIDRYAELVSLPVYQWNRCVVVPPKHPLLKGSLTLEKLAQHPIVTYDYAFANRSLVQKAFEARGLAPQIVLSAQDSDVIKTYVELGLGVGIVASIAFVPGREGRLRLLDAGTQFPENVTRIAVRRGHYLRDYGTRFIGMCAPALDDAMVRRALNPEREPATA
jgi:DNA-binding transcriptional LysR family regulator